MRITELNDKKDVADAMQFVLDLAMEKVPCEAGSVLQADLSSGDLSFITATGPKAKELLRSKVVIPVGTGIAGFCAFEGVSVAVSDVQKDPRFYAAIGEKIDYETKSLLCAPMMTHGRSFGCLQLINRKGGPQFAEHEVGVLAYLAHQAALYLNTRS
jgi:GAF domain-containing protein